MVHIHIPSTQEAEAERSQIGGQPGLYSETLSQKKIFFLKRPVVLVLANWTRKKRYDLKQESDFGFCTLVRLNRNLVQITKSLIKST
jgi:hypothetical protein